MIGHEHEITAAEDRRAFEEALKANPLETLTIDSIEQNPWHAVAHGLPDDASAELAAAVVRATDDLGERATQWAELANADDAREHWLDVAELAQMRGENAALAEHELAARAAWREPAFSRATIEADPWTAVHLPIPDKAEPELLALARDWASDLERYAEVDGALSQPFVNAENYTREENVIAAAERVGVLDGRLWLANERGEPMPQQQQGQSHSEFLSGGFIASRAGAHLARTVEMLLGAVLGYFVPEPELTPEQARTVALANAERGEAHEFEAARQANAAALDWVNSEISRHRPSILPLRGDEPTRPDSLNERYPGLTRYDDEPERDRDHERSR